MKLQMMAGITLALAMGVTAARASQQVTGVVTATADKSLEIAVAGREMTTVAVDAKTEYVKWITHAPWQQDSRATAGSVAVGSCVDVELRAGEGRIARIVRVSKDGAGTLYDPCKRVRSGITGFAMNDFRASAHFKGGAMRDVTRVRFDRLRSRGGRSCGRRDPASAQNADVVCDCPCCRIGAPSGVALAASDESAAVSASDAALADCDEEISPDATAAPPSCRPTVWRPGWSSSKRNSPVSRRTRLVFRRPHSRLPPRARRQRRRPWICRRHSRSATSPGSMARPVTRRWRSIRRSSRRKCGSTRTTCSMAIIPSTTRSSARPKVSGPTRFKRNRSAWAATFTSTTSAAAS